MQFYIDDIAIADQYLETVIGNDCNLGRDLFNLFGS